MVLAPLAQANSGVDFLNKTLDNVRENWSSGGQSSPATAAWVAVKSKSPGALKQLEAIAQGGDAEAQNMMGWLYDNADARYGVKSNPSSAVAFFRAAANQGHDVAIYNIGVLTYYGRGLPVNVESAYKWFSRAAQSNLVSRACVRAALLGMQGNKDAFQINTNVQCATNNNSATGFFLRGKIEYDEGRFSVAEMWLSKAANALEPNAPWLLSQLYSRSPGLQINKVMAAGWWEIGARLNPKKKGVNAIGLSAFGLTENEKLKANHFAQLWISRHPLLVEPINYSKTIIGQKD